MKAMALTTRGTRTAKGAAHIDWLRAGRKCVVDEFPSRRGGTWVTLGRWPPTPALRWRAKGVPRRTLSKSHFPALKFGGREACNGGAPQVALAAHGRGTLLLASGGPSSCATTTTAARSRLSHSSNLGELAACFR